MADVDVLFIQVKRRMIENGDWNKYAQLRESQ
jgi:hypothetical protein